MGPPPNPISGPVGRPVVGPEPNPVSRPVGRPVVGPEPNPVSRPVGPTNGNGNGNDGFAAGIGNANVVNGNAVATGQAIAQAPPGGFALSFGTGIALSTPFGDHVISLGDAIVIGKK